MVFSVSVVKYAVWSCRMFVRVADDTVTVVCAEIHGGVAGRWMVWTAEAIQKGCRTLLRMQQLRDANNSISMDFCMNASKPDVDEMSIDELVPPVLAGVLLSLDWNTQFCTSRVCTLWRLIPREYCATRHITFDLRQIRVKVTAAHAFDAQEFAYLNTYRMLAILNGIITARTRSLAMIYEGNSGNDFYVKLLLLRDILAGKGLRVPLLIVRNGLDSMKEAGDSFLALKWNYDKGENCRCGMVFSLMDVCQQLILLNYTASDRNGNESRVNMFHTAPNLPWPEHEPGIARGDADGQLDVVIPVVRFRSTETEAEHCRRFLAAVTTRCPAVTKRMRKKVAKAHARWVEMLVYPDEWSDIRRFLQLFSDPAETKQWDEVDLRKLDVAALSKLTVHLLDGYYKD
ncbi:uncharacterized protein LOC129592954 [Paramacrobiotus metropolitanus]|uniref:uncharacterized protein LOC129592954 n=1 Tax=Paramacrobiotus metropolitanus TaxID=2943436 RepID=UPI0024456F86|nr:uncharacterized protein LOC129592954 [Paramacrobiotus metropolitanus]